MKRKIPYRGLNILRNKVSNLGISSVRSGRLQKMEVKHNLGLEKIKNVVARDALREMRLTPGMTQEKYDKEITRHLNNQSDV